MPFPSTTNFSIGLLNYTFDSSNGDVRLYKDKIERDISLSSKVEVTQESVNVPFRDNINFTVKYNINQLSETQILKILNYNYCQIKNNSTNECIYYFITSSTQIDSTMIALSLTIDHIQTYYYDLSFPLATIEQAHLDRWIPDPDNPTAFKFNNKVDSPLFSNNLPELPKYLDTREEISFFPDTKENSPINEEIMLNVSSWVIIYLYSENPDGTTQNTFKGCYNLKNKKNGIVQGYNVIFAPIYKSNDFPKIYLRDELGEEVLWEIDNINDLLNSGTTSTFIASIKISPICPLEQRLYFINDDYEIKNNKLIFILKDRVSVGFNKQFYIVTYTDGAYEGLVMGLDYQQGRSYNYGNYYGIQVFTLEEIIANDNNIDKEPHLLNQNIRELRLTDYNGNSFIFDIQKLGTQKDVFIIDILSPDIQKSYLSFSGEEETIYNDTIINSYLGLVSNNSISVPFNVSQLQQFLSQNKNFFQQNDYNRNMNILTKLLAGLGLSIATGNPIPLITSVGYATLDNVKSVANQNFMVDNLKSTPDTLKNVQGNLLLSFTTNQNLPFYKDYYTPTDYDLQKVFWLVFMFGYPLSITDNLKSYDSTRIIFNYVKAQISLISGAVSNQIKSLFKQSFSQGVRFWHQDTINYNLSNYERYLVEDYEIIYSGDQTINGDLPIIFQDGDTLSSNDNTIEIELLPGEEFNLFSTDNTIQIQLNTKGNQNVITKLQH